MLADADTLIETDCDAEAVAQRVSEAVEEPLAVVLAQSVSEAVDEPLAVVLEQPDELGELDGAFDFEGSDDGVAGGEDAIGVAVGACDELPVGEWE